MKEIKSAHVDDSFLANLLGIESSKIGYYGEVKQKIQELENANMDLRVKRTELQAVFNAISDGVVIYDSKGFVQHRNHVCPKFFPEETQLGNSCCELFHDGKVLASHFCPVERAINGESTQLSFAVTHEGYERNRYYDATATPIPAPEGDPSVRNRALVFIRDITERRTRELEFTQAEKMSSIGLLAAGIAHEINNPMTSVAGYAEALQRRFRDDITLAGDQRLIDFPKYLETIIREVYRCKGIIHSLQSFSRKSDGVLCEVDLNKIIGEVLELVRHTYRDKHIELITILSNVPPRIRGNFSSMRQVFMNLVLNGFQSIENSGTVTIESKIVGSEVVISIVDSGVGISPQNLDQIWTPFFTTKVVGRGQGLGLAVTYDIVEKHHGTIEVRSKLGEGTEFSVKFPKY